MAKPPMPPDKFVAAWRAHDAQQMATRLSTEADIRLRTRLAEAQAPRGRWRWVAVPSLALAVAGLLVWRWPAPTPAPRTAGWVSDVAVRPAPDWVALLEANQEVRTSDDQPVRLRSLRPAALKREAGGLRLVRGQVEVASATSATVFVAQGRVTAARARFVVAQFAAGGEVSVVQGTVTFVGEAGEILSLQAGMHATWDGHGAAVLRPVASALRFDAPGTSEAPVRGPVVKPDGDGVVRAAAPSRSATSVPAAAAPVQGLDAATSQPLGPSGSTEVTGSGVPPAPVREAGPPNLETALMELEALRSRGQHAQAAAHLRGLWAGVLPSDTAERLSFELGVVLGDALGELKEACGHWQAHARRFPAGRYAEEVARMIATHGCR